MDASDNAAGAVLQQKAEDGHWPPLSFSSRRFQPRETRYSALRRELLAACLAIRHFRYLLEGRHFALVTDQKPLVQAILHGSSMHTLREARQLDITSLTSDVLHIKGERNAVADAMPRISVGSLSVLPDSAKVEQLARAQSAEEELQHLQRNTTSLEINKVHSSA
ncbi:hypothetical protein M514_19650 [Trichuris suis]|uniref:Reverse transcriptase RNase H-like domain-containing protein n=1 Tax=Trichuris suis TaxID=68888 RepID=A0A085NFC2_9BILA|nr:hypothetical protein M514_19650 [Trichuris suis]KHJ44580.1 hypothetical protein D918_05245 [Trichuris suis]